MNIENAKKIACDLIQLHLGPEWSFKWSRAKKCFGVCQHSRRTIKVSKPLVSLNDEASVRDTILHEIAHALINIGHGHDHVWKARCREIGAEPVRCFKGSVNVPTSKYKVVCECGKEFSRNKRIRRGYLLVCPICNAKMGNEDFQLNFT